MNEVKLFLAVNVPNDRKIYNRTLLDSKIKYHISFLGEEKFIFKYDFNQE